MLEFCWSRETVPRDDERGRAKELTNRRAFTSPCNGKEKNPHDSIAETRTRHVTWWWWMMNYADTTAKRNERKGMGKGRSLDPEFFSLRIRQGELRNFVPGFFVPFLLSESL